MKTNSMKIAESFIVASIIGTASIPNQNHADLLVRLTSSEKIVHSEAILADVAKILLRQHGFEVTGEVKVNDHEESQEIDFNCFSCVISDRQLVSSSPYNLTGTGGT